MKSNTPPELRIPGPVPKLRIDFAQPSSAYSRLSRQSSGSDGRPARFKPATTGLTQGHHALPPGINRPASFHEAHYVQQFARIRNRGTGAPFALDGDNDPVRMPG